MGKTFLAYTYAPVLFLSVLGSGVFLIQMGLSSYMLVGLFLGALLVSFVAERILPYEQSWNQPHVETTKDVTHAIVNELSMGLGILLFPAIASLLPSFEIWPAQWHLGAQLLLAIVIADIGITLTHYASHNINILWKFHSPHHAVKRFYGLNGLVKHPLHQMLETGTGILPLILMGMPAFIAALLGLAVATQLLLQDSNVDVKVGKLRFIWALAPIHRFHHQNSAKLGNVNFGLFLVIWDMLLGTYEFEANRQFSSVDLGIEDHPDYPTSYRGQLTEPFKTPTKTHHNIGV